MVGRSRGSRLVAVAVACTALVAVSGDSGTVAGSAAALSAGPCTVAQVVRTWSPRRLARQTVVVPVDEHGVGAVADQVAAGVGGVILFGSSAPADLGTDLARLLDRAPDGIVPVVMADEEGGAVQRMANLVGEMPSARTMAATMTTTRVRRLARRVGGRMHDLHVTMNLAPVLDLDDRPGPSATNPDGTRSFSIDQRTTRVYGMAFARGMRHAGVVPVVKHFPGLGHATGNTDVAPADTVRWATLREHGLRPFVRAIRLGLPAVMVTNARVPGLTRLPATLSRRAVHGVLRKQLGFGGLVVTDSLSAGAVSAAGFSVRRAAVQTLAAGSDMILFNAAPQDVARTTRHVVRSVARAVDRGDLSLRRLRAAATHVLEAKDAPVCG